MKTLSGTSLTSEMCWDRQMMEDTFPFGRVTLWRDGGMALRSLIDAEGSSENGSSPAVSMN